jgi:hypothetical protein
LRIRLLRMVGQLPDKLNGWRWAVASVVGSSHIATGLPCQDAYAIRSLNGGSLFAVVADGAGSAEFGRQGAWHLVRHLCSRVQDKFSEDNCLPTDEEIWDWIDEYRDLANTLASSRDAQTRQFACTLAALIISPDGVLAIQVGDSAAVGRNNGDWASLIWPENGEYASTTYFVTDDPEPRLKIHRFAEPFDAFAVFSDGIGEIALLQIEERPFEGFLDPMMSPIDARDDAGKLTDLSNALARYLGSPAVCERTDDDKTLILISKA